MKRLMLLVCASCFLAATQVSAGSMFDDDDEYEEVVVRRKKKRPAPPPPAEETAPVAVAPVAVTPAVIVPAVVGIPVAQPVAPVVKGEPDEPPPPPEPPAAEAAEPRRLVHYFCNAWKDQDYERLWWAMSPQYRKSVSLKKFTKLFESDAELNGGLKDENILEAGTTRDGNEGVKVELIFKFPRAKHRFVTAIAERQPGGAFRIVESPFIPKDLDDL